MLKNGWVEKENSKQFYAGEQNPCTIIKASSSSNKGKKEDIVAYLGWQASDELNPGHSKTGSKPSKTVPPLIPMCVNRRKDSCEMKGADGGPCAPYVC